VRAGKRAVSAQGKCAVSAVGQVSVASLGRLTLRPANASAARLLGCARMGLGKLRSEQLHPAPSILWPGPCAPY